MKKIELQDLRHTASLVLGAAATEVFPQALLVDGFATRLGFYYDFVFPFPFKQEFISLLEEGMRKIIKEKRLLKELEMVPSNAAELLNFKKQPLRAESVAKNKKNLISLVQMGEFVDYQPFNYPQDTGIVGAFKLTHFIERQEESYITRVIGTAFFDKVELKASLKQKLQLDPIDHKKLGLELSLFAPFDTEGNWMWLPKGELLRQALVDYWKKEHIEENFQFISAPSLEISEEHLKFFNHKKIAQLGYVHDTDVINGKEGMLEPKGYFQDLAHIFCGEEDLLNQSISSLQFILKIFKITGFKYSLVLCPNGAGREGSSPYWKRCVETLRTALKQSQLEYNQDVEEISLGGPKIEVRLQDDLGREWAGPFIRLDSRGLVRSTFGCMERFIALFLEQGGGTLPFFLAPEQLRIIDVGSGGPQFKEYITRLTCNLRSIGVRVTFDTRKDPLKKRVRDALLDRIPFTVVIGDKELTSNCITIRSYPVGEESISMEDFLIRLGKLLKR